MQSKLHPGPGAEIFATMQFPSRRHRFLILPVLVVTVKHGSHGPALGRECDRVCRLGTLRWPHFIHLLHRGSIQVSGGATAKSGAESEKLCRLGVHSSVPRPRNQRVNHRLPELLSKQSTRFRLRRVGPCERQLCEGDSVQLARQENSHVMGRVCYVFVWVKEKIWG